LKKSAKEFGKYPLVRPKKVRRPITKFGKGLGNWGCRKPNVGHDLPPRRTGKRGLVERNPEGSKDGLWSCLDDARSVCGKEKEKKSRVKRRSIYGFET